MKIHGSCHCQAVRYEVESNEPYPYQKCYCSICRKTSGGEGYTINLSADSKTLKIDGEEHLETYRALLSPDARQSNHHRRFCRHCGSHLWAWNNTWPELLHPVASSVDSALPKTPCYTHIMLNISLTGSRPSPQQTIFVLVNIPTSRSLNGTNVWRIFNPTYN